MKPDWDTLADEFKDSPTTLIADVDCTAAGKTLCEKHGVKGYPTIKTFAAGDEEGEKYEGGRDLDSLRKHASSIKPQCSADAPDNCTAEQRMLLEKYMGMSEARRKAKILKLQNAIDKAEAAHETVQKGLQAQFDASNKKLEALREEKTPIIKLIRAATPKASV